MGKTVNKKQIFIIKKKDDMYDIFCNLWRLLEKIPWDDEEGHKRLNDFKSRLPKVNMYWDAFDLAKEFTKKLGYELIKEK